jgi:hypothetical protein
MEIAGALCKVFGKIGALTFSGLTMATVSQACALAILVHVRNHPNRMNTAGIYLRHVSDIDRCFLIASAHSDVKKHPRVTPPPQIGSIT